MEGTVATGFEVTFDTRGLPLGAELRLCSDLDGASPLLTQGDSGHSVHMTAISMWTSTASAQGQMTVNKAAAQEIKLDCPEGCTMDTTLSLIPHASKCGSTAVAVSALLPDGAEAVQGALGGYGNIAWKAVFDTSVLSVGRYRLCYDLDG